MNQSGDRGPGGPEPSTINMRRLLITAAVLILISAGLLFWGRDVIREAVVIPISILLWGLRILVQGTPQIFFWIVALLIAGLVAYYSLSGRRKPVAPAPLGVSDSQPVYTSGRAVFWANKANLLQAGEGGYAESNSHMAVVRLLVDMLAYRYRLPARTVEEQIRDGSLGTLGVPSIPPQVMAYLRGHLVRSEPPAVGSWALAWRSLV